MSLKLCTYNIRFIFDRYDEREQLLHKVLLENNADVYAFQEVLIGGYFVGQTHDILSILNKSARGKVYNHFDCEGFRLYCEAIPFGIGILFHNPIASICYDIWALLNKYFLCFILGKHIQFIYHHIILKVICYFTLGTCWVFGTALLYNQQIVNKSSLSNNLNNKILIGNWRGVNFVELNINNKVIIVINVHLSSHSTEEDLRMNEILLIDKWIHTLSYDGNIIMGDFNMKPGGLCYQLMEKLEFISVYKSVHKSEPVITFHQKHTCITKDIDDENCLDYIWYKGACIHPKKDPKYTKLIGLYPDPSDDTLYASDHFGIFTELDIQ